MPIGPPGRFQSIMDQTRNFLYIELDLAHAAAIVAGRVRHSGA